MSLVVGQYYYWLTPEQYDSIPDVFEAEGQTNIFEQNDYILGPDGYYYAAEGNIDQDEYDWLLEHDLLQDTYYSKSTQPGGSL